MIKKKLVILDSNSLLNRAFYALPPMNNSKGQPTGAVYGFTMMLFKILDDIKPDYIAAAFDKSKVTFRTEEYAEYKAGRKKMPEELAQQFEPVKDILRAFNIGIFEIQGYEADDIIGTISKRFESMDTEVIIYTGDRDALQLVSEYTRVMFTKKGITDIDIYDISLVNERYGLEPSGIIELKALMGDASDNIPGVKGIGEKTALKLLHEYKTVENIYENIDNISGKKLNENLKQYKDDAFMSKRLATIDREVPIEVDIDRIKISDLDTNRIVELFKEYEFKSLLNRIKITDEKKANSPLDIPDIKEFKNENILIEEINKKKVFNFLFLFKNTELEGMIIEGNYFVSCDNLHVFKEIFASRDIIKNTLGAKQVYNYLNIHDYAISKIDFDFEIASYLLNPSESKYEIKDMMDRYTELNFSEEISNTREGLAIFVSNMDKIKSEMMDKIISYGMEELFDKVEMPLVKVLSSMETYGFRVDKETLHSIGFRLSEEIDGLTSEIYDLAGEEFNINSPKQLGVILFEKLGLPIIKKTKTGYSTDAEVLEELSSRHEIVEKILVYRQFVKLKSTYIDGLMSTIDNNKIHSSFNQTVTATGRISSTEPNLQNIPIKMEQGRQIRKAFIPTTEEYMILSADYSQIELRVLAHMSKDKSLIEAFVRGQDIHTRTASEVFGIPMDEVTSLQRSRAKAVNFGIVYGLSDYGLSKDIKITRKEAKQYIDNYFNRYTGVKEYLDEAINHARELGYVKTLMNRVRYIPEINSKNRNIKMFGERLAMNTPIQGTAADIIKISMVNVFNRLRDEKLKSRIILQVHDELILEVHKDEIEQAKKIIKQEMESAINLDVPLIVDINIGNNWYEAK